MGTAVNENLKKNKIKPNENNFRFEISGKSGNIIIPIMCVVSNYMNYKLQFED